VSDENTRLTVRTYAPLDAFRYTNSGRVYINEGRAQVVEYVPVAEVERLREALAHIHGFFVAGWPDVDDQARIAHIARIALNLERP
jgi:hypothetical protein